MSNISHKMLFGKKIINIPILTTIKCEFFNYDVNNFLFYHLSFYFHRFFKNINLTDFKCQILTDIIFLNLNY